MSTKGNTGQSSDKLSPLGNPDDHYGTGYGAPNPGFKSVSNRGNKGGNDVGLGKASTPLVPNAPPYRGKNPGI